MKLAPLLLTFIACLAAVLMCGSGKGLATGQKEKDALDWIRLIKGDGFEGWCAADRARADDWIHAGGAMLSAGDEKLLSSLPGTGTLINGDAGRTRHLITEAEFGDVLAHIEFMVPKGSNSGVYFMGRYEIQVLDSFGKAEVAHSDCGGIYQRWESDRGKGKEGYEGRPPRVNASRPPGRWQSFDVVFCAPRFDAAGKKTANARFVKVVHNGVVIHENEDLTGPTRAAAFRDEKPAGPFMFQGDHGPVAFRNLWVLPLGADGETDALDRTRAGLTLPAAAVELDSVNPLVARMVPRALAGFGGDALPALAGALCHRDPGVRLEAARAVGRLDGSRKVLEPELAAALSDRIIAVRCAAAFALRGSGHHDEAVAVLIEGLEMESRGFAAAAARYLGEIGPGARAAIPALEKMTGNERELFRKAAAKALDKIVR
jgi:hypothetical protein